MRNTKGELTMRNELSPQVIKRILELKKTGMKNLDIAREVGCGRDSVRKYIILYGNSHDIDLRTTAEKITDLWNKGYDANHIAEELHMSASAVRTNIVKIGLREKRVAHAGQADAFKKKLPPLKAKPTTDIFYPDRTYEVKRYQDRGKKYFDVSEVYGL